MNKINYDFNLKHIIYFNIYIQQTLMDVLMIIIDLPFYLFTNIIYNNIYLLLFRAISFKLVIVNYFNKHLTPSLEKTIIAVRAFNFIILAVRIIGCPCSRFKRQFTNLYDEYYFMVWLSLYFCSDITYFIYFI